MVYAKILMLEETLFMDIYNTLTRNKQAFEPLNPGNVKMYCCGPTVYNFAHIGNLRTYVFEDLLRRTLEFEGYTVKHVMNITDVGHLTSDADDGEDKMLKGARREKKTVWEIAEFYTKAFFKDMARLNLLHPTLICKATDHIPEMIGQIRLLEKNGLTYVSKGNVYFDTSKPKDYGKLARLDEQELKAGARIEVDPGKKHPYDFVLWFTHSKHGNQDMQWDSPWGQGFPGWHIECSAMSVKYLGKQFDIHCGGIDHISVHHTNEIAQAEGALKKKPWVKYWLHGNFLVIGDSAKMAKSGENFLTLQTLIDRGFDPLDYRYFCLQAHYRQELTFSWDALSAAKTARRRLHARVQELGDTEGDVDEKYLGQFSAALEDDLNVSQALATAWSLLDDENVKPEAQLATLKKFDTVLGLKLDEPIEFEVPPAVSQLALERNEARKNKDWKKSDELRLEIQKLGFEVSDHGSQSSVKPM